MQRQESILNTLLVLMLATRSVSSFATVSRRAPLRQLPSSAAFFVAPYSASSIASSSSSASSNNNVLENDDKTTTLLLDPLIICGPSGVGKGTLINRFMTDSATKGHERFGFSVSHTTREPRQGEVHGEHYHFVSLQEMDDLRSNQAFLETANVHGNHYGTSFQALQDVQATGKRCLLDIDVQGVQHIKSLQEEEKDSNLEQLQQFALEPVYIFIAPPSLAVLETRLLGRNSETASSLQTRLSNAAAELEYGLSSGTFDAVVINDDLEQAVRTLDETIQELYDNRQ